MESKNYRIDKELFIPQHNCSLDKYYEKLSKIGKGGYSKVINVRNKKTNIIRACKKISKMKIEDIDLLRFRREINILKKVDHPNIIKTYEIFETNKSLYLVMEKCNGGPLFEKIVEHINNDKMYTEKSAFKIMLKLMSAINYCHKIGICHRDIKPENILFLNKESEENNELKLIDFGLSHYINDKKLNSKVGTTYYIAPEVISGEYNETCDIWSAGIILCVLLTGVPPFNGPNDIVIYNKIKNLQYSFSPKWKYISIEAKELVSHMLVPEKIRYSAEQVLAHPWFQINMLDTENLNINFTLLNHYYKMNLFKKIILILITTKMEENIVIDINKIFKEFDKDNDGVISLKEFQNVLKNYIKLDEIINLFNSLDLNKEGKIYYSTFISANLPKEVYLKKELLNEAFNFFDKNKKGIITIDDILSSLQLKSNENLEIEQIIKNIKKNEEGVIGKNEFHQFMLLD